MSECELKQYITNVLDGKDETIVQMSKGNRACCREMVINLNITEKTFQKALEEICDNLFTGKCDSGYYTSLLIFCIELDSFHKGNSSWYTRDMLVEILLSILLKLECKRKSRYFTYYIWLCSISLVITLLLL